MVSLATVITKKSIVTQGPLSLNEMNCFMISLTYNPGSSHHRSLWRLFICYLMSLQYSHWTIQLHLVILQQSMENVKHELQTQEKLVTLPTYRSVKGICSWNKAIRHLGKKRHRTVNPCYSIPLTFKSTINYEYEILTTDLTDQIACPVRSCTYKWSYYVPQHPMKMYTDIAILEFN